MADRWFEEYIDEKIAEDIITNSLKKFGEAIGILASQIKETTQALIDFSKKYDHASKTL